MRSTADDLVYISARYPNKQLKLNLTKVQRKEEDPYEARGKPNPKSIKK